MVVVDLDEMKVVEVIDHGVVPLPPKPGNYYPELAIGDPENVPVMDGLRNDIKPIEITQPEGPSFTVDGSHVHVAEVAAADRLQQPRGARAARHRLPGRRHPAADLHRASLGEMFIPYGDPQPTQSTEERLRHGRVRHRLAGQPAGARLRLPRRDPLLRRRRQRPGRRGRRRSRTRSACTRRTTASAGSTPTSAPRRSRSAACAGSSSRASATVGNYEYGFFWYLYNDGTIELRGQAHRLPDDGALPVGEDTPYGQVLAPGLYGPHHQHFFSVRLDMEVDGPQNRVVEVDSVPEPYGPDNPIG